MSIRRLIVNGFFVSIMFATASGVTPATVFAGCPLGYQYSDVEGASLQTTMVATITFASNWTISGGDYSHQHTLASAGISGTGGNFLEGGIMVGYANGTDGSQITTTSPVLFAYRTDTGHLTNLGSYPYGTNQQFSWVRNSPGNYTLRLNGANVTGYVGVSVPGAYGFSEQGEDYSSDSTCDTHDARFQGPAQPYAFCDYTSTSNGTPCPGTNWDACRWGSNSFAEVYYTANNPLWNCGRPQMPLDPVAMLVPDQPPIRTPLPMLTP